MLKGGTSLSKSYHVIERFSEDIDLIFNKQINAEAAKFYKDEFVPILNEELVEKLGEETWVSVVRSCVRLEIGPLAEWMPSHETVVTPFVAEKYPNIFKQKFYYAKSAHYETATMSNIELLPSERILSELQEDYRAMYNMIYGKIPELEEILAFLEKLQTEIHGLK